MATEIKSPASAVARSAPTEAAINRLAVTHPTATVYLDESGVIKADRFFGIGCLKVVDGPKLTRALRRYRQVMECGEELHWSRLDKATSRTGRTFELATAALDTFFELEGASFCCTVADRQNGDLAKNYHSSWQAYEALSIRALDAAIDERELVSVLADHVDTPRDVQFEESVQLGLNGNRGRLTIATITRVHSHAVDGLQLADLLLGAAMFDFRQGATRGGLRNDSQKARLSAQLLDRCGVPTFRPAGRAIEGKIRVEMQKPRRTRRRRRGGDPT